MFFVQPKMYSIFLNYRTNVYISVRNVSCWQLPDFTIHRKKSFCPIGFDMSLKKNLPSSHRQAVTCHKNGWCYLILSANSNREVFILKVLNYTSQTSKERLLSFFFWLHQEYYLNSSATSPFFIHNVPISGVWGFYSEVFNPFHWKKYWKFFNQD